MKLLIDDKYLVSVQGLDFETVFQDLRVVRRIRKSYGGSERIVKVELSNEIPTMTLIPEILIAYPDKDYEIVDSAPEVPDR